MRSVVIHFLNVGHGDCTIIEHASGRVTMIDINNSKELPETDEVALAESRGLTLSAFRSSRGMTKSWEQYYQSLLVDPADYWSSKLSRKSVFRYIQTHPDMDHMSGLCRLFYRDGVALTNFWDTSHNKTFVKAEFDEGRYEWNDWVVYNRLRKGYVQDADAASQPITVHHKTLGVAGNYWTEDGLSVLSPTAELVDYCNKTENWNNVSYILALSFGGRTVILPGDAEKPAWDSVEAHVDEDALDCDVLKAAHHGRLSGFSESAVAAMAPAIVVCSVGKKPATDASDGYKDLGADVLSTRYNGTLKCTIWEDGELRIDNPKGEQVAWLPARNLRGRLSRYW